jgi:PPP family 3-phenylpropionic acid transporter
MQAELAETRFTALRVAVFYVAIFSIIGCYIAFLPIWLEWRGLSKTEISLLFALPLLVRVVFTPVISYLADKAGNRREVVFWLAQFSFVALLALPFTSSTALIFVCLTVYALGWTSIMPLTETIAVAAARASTMDGCGCGGR